MTDTQINQNLGRDIQTLVSEASRRMVSEPIKNEDGSTTFLIGCELQTHTVPAINMTLPSRVVQTETFVEPASFIEYLNLFKTANTINKASLLSNRVVAVLDYHEPTTETGAPVPKYGDHVVTLACPFDLDFQAWTRRLGVDMNQIELAEFIEDMLHTIGSPPAADLVEAITDMKVDRGVKFKSAVNDRDGTVKLTYEEEDTSNGGGSITLPREIKVVCPVFQGGDPITLDVRLRYKIARSALTFSLAIPGLDRIKREEFKRVGENIQTGTSTPLFFTS